ncbi:MAG: DNA translocase FtsK 4TM domain-containing protein, partial [Gaiellales bacterium]
MATRSRSSKPAPKKPAAKAAPKRKPAARKPAARKPAARKSTQPSPLPRLVAGLGLTLLGLFLALLLWVGVDGSMVGGRLKDGSHVAFGAFAIFLPVILVGCGALILQKNLSPGLRRRLAGVPLILLALLLALSNDETSGKLSENAGGFVGGNLHKLLGSAAGDAGVLLLIVALAVSGVVLLAGQKLSVLWQAFWETVVDVYAATVEWLDDRSARRALAKEEAERQALIEHREASRTRKTHVQPLADEPEEIVYPDPIHEVWGDESAQAEATAEPTFPPAEPTPVPVAAAKEPTAEPSWEQPVAETPESVFADDESGEPT